MSLYFGCRKREEDYLYESEIREMSDKDILNGVRVAFSRDEGKKVYVQDLIREDQEAIYEAVYKEKARVYLCGS
jgi:NADPH-ferrihemoprotein reductase